MFPVDRENDGDVLIYSGIIFGLMFSTGVIYGLGCRLYNKFFPEEEKFTPYTTKKVVNKSEIRDSLEDKVDG